MPGRSRPSFSKRQKEQARREKQRAKLERKRQRRLEKGTPGQEEDSPATSFAAEDDGETAGFLPDESQGN